MKINGGQRSGNNLFHSFEEFNIPAGMEAAFENATEIENIFTRVTGDSVSAIDGILSAQGGANLFLMNPNGIVFGTDASINIGGSFIATTADNIQFGEGQEFAASEAENDALINVRFPIAFGFNEEPGGSITVNGAGNNITNASLSSPTIVENNQRGLSVESGETLGLIGGDITIDGGTLQTDGGSVELGSIGFGALGIQQAEGKFAFNYSNINNYQDINLSNESVIDNSGEGVGGINLTGNNIAFQDGSSALIQTTGTSASGDITITSSESTNFSGTSPDGNASSVIRTENIGSAAGLNITISTADLILRDGASIAANTFGNAQAGNVTIDASNSIGLLENNFVDPARPNFITSTMGSATFGEGDAGSVKLSTQQLKMKDGAVIASSTFSSGDGNTTTVDADFIDVEGIREDRLSPSVITGTTAGSGNAGDVVLNTSELQVRNGGSINTSGVANGDAGNLTINANESIKISGRSSQSPSSISSSVVSQNVTQGPIELPEVAQGDAGEIDIDTPNLNIDSGGTISVRNSGVGNAGTVNIKAESVNLNDSSSISAAFTSGSGGNINIDTDSLQIDNESQITARAGSEGGGGNININATNISAKKNSAISANAQDAKRPSRVLATL